MKQLLEINNLVTTFPNDNNPITVVDQVSFKIGYGETVAVVGESGSGKSMTAMSIMGLVAHDGGKVTSGEILFEGIDLLSKSEKEMKNISGNKISMIFQEPMTSLNPLLTIGKQIVETMRRHKKISNKEAVKKAISLLEMVGIPEPDKRIGYYPFQLSGGQIQRVMIAMALSCGPQLLIADEPTTALDVTIQAQILDVMKALKKTIAMSIMLITHDLGVVADIADRVVVMYGGQVVEQGTVEDIFKRPQHPYTQGLLKSIPRIEKAEYPLYMIPGNVSRPEQYSSGCRFFDRCTKKIGTCKDNQPQLISINDQQEVRCWLLNKENQEKGSKGEHNG